MLERSKDRLDRNEAALERADARAAREQAEVDRAAAEGVRELVRQPADPGELAEQAKTLRRRLWAAAGDLAAVEKQAARIRDVLAAHDPEREVNQARRPTD
jgi:hypothetical protein